MNENDQKKLASKIVLKARAECKDKKINSYIAIGAFIDEIIRELSMYNTDKKIAEFLISVSEKVKMGVYRKNK